MENESNFSILNPFADIDIGLADWADGIKQWAIENREFTQPIKNLVNDMIVGLDSSFQAVPPLIMMAILTLLAWQTAGRRVAGMILICLILISVLDPRAWSLTMTTMAIVVSAVIICVAIGLPLGLLAGKSDGFEVTLRPILDTMQTIPAFVYLVPVVMLIGIGNVSGVIVTVVFAMPPMIRLTSLGIRQVDRSVVEAARAFGSSPLQSLTKVELPLAMPSIMAGVNQTIMLALSMVVIASMISVKGLGNEVLRAMGRLDAGKAIVGGLGIVLLAIVLDRITQGVGQSGRTRVVRHWWMQGPVGLAVRIYRKAFGKDQEH